MDRLWPSRTTWGWHTVLVLVLALALLGALSYVLVGLPLVVLLGVAGVCVFHWWHGHSQELLTMRARPADPVADADVIGMVEELAAAAEVEVPDVYVSDMPCPNAFAVRTRRGAAVCVTQQLRDALTTRELRAVMAHEISHVKNNDSAFTLLFDAVTRTLMYTMAAVGVLLAVLMAMGARRRRDEEDAAAFGFLIALIGLVASKLVFSAAIRQRERVADRDGAQLCGDPMALTSALQRMDGLIARRPLELGFSGAAVASLCIMSPFGGGGLSWLTSTHPSTRARIRRLARLVTPESRAQFEYEQAKEQWAADVQRLQRRIESLRNRKPRALPPGQRLPFELRRAEGIWDVVPCELVEQRSRQGVPTFTVVDSGKLFVSTSRLVFAGEGKRTEWRFDKIHDIRWEQPETGAAWLKISVTNRQKPSGIAFPAADVPSAASLIETAVAAAEGNRGRLLESLEARLLDLQAAAPRQADLTA